MLNKASDITNFSMHIPSCSLAFNSWVPLLSLCTLALRTLVKLMVDDNSFVNKWVSLDHKGPKGPWVDFKSSCEIPEMDFM